MTTAHTLSAGSSARSGNRLVDLSGLIALFKGIADGWRGYNTFNALNDLDDATLAARGLKRADLPRIALEAIQRKG
ncbi:MAG: hypothetical protein ACK4GC_01160 [Paracoccaceae bacterium]